MKNQPYISVILPAFNEEKKIAATLEALERQTYPADRYEIILVDNGSSDQTKEIAAQFDKVRVIDELSAQGPDPCRNTGIQQAKGDVVAFLDADCRAKGNWLEEGIQILDEQNADLAGGQVIFELSDNPTAAEYYEISNLVTNKETIAKRGVTGGGNLFVRRKVFEAGVTFPRDLPSSGDTYFTAHASRAGFKIVYAPGAVVHHPTHNPKGLLRKAMRTGSGKMSVWKMAMNTRTMNKSMVGQRGFSRLNPMNLKQRLRDKGHQLKGLMFWKVYFFSLLWLFMFCVGMGMGLLRSPRSSNVIRKRSRKRKIFYPW